MTKERTFQFIAEVGEWFARMEEQEQRVAVELLEEGYGEFREWLDRFHADIGSSLSSLMKHVVGELRSKSEEEVNALLSGHEVVSPSLSKALLKTAKSHLRYYTDSQALRNAEPEEFIRIVTLVIRDYFVERRNTTLSRRMQYLNLQDAELVKKHYTVLLNLIHNFYDREFTLEELELFMEQEMGFGAEKIVAFCNILLDYKPQLDQYFLSRKLSIVMELLQES